MAIEERAAAARPQVEPRREPRRARREREEEVFVWPDLVFIEFIAAVLFTFAFIVLSTLINAPLLNQANPNLTPNPAKAPWYFLNLQELLLHMHPALAGVVVPTVALLLLAVIPYIDRSNEGQGIWFGTNKSVRISIFSAIYAVIINWALVLFDAGKFESVTRWFPGLTKVQETAPDGTTMEVAKGFLSLRDLQTRWHWSIGPFEWPKDVSHIPVPFNNLTMPDWLGGKGGWFDKLFYPDNLNINLPAVMVEQIIPIGFMVGFSVILVLILKKMGWVQTTRDVMIALFSGFIATYWTLTIIGSFFRGEGMQLVPPWDVKVDEG